MKVKIVNLDNVSHGEIELDASIFGLPVRADILHRVVEWQRAKRRAGTHKTKGISDISGTTKKPFKQKGSGNARQGSLRSPQFRGGAVIFGPVVRSHAYDLPKKVRKLGLKTALSSKYAEGKLFVWPDAKANAMKTKDMVAKFKAMGFSSPLIIDGQAVDENFAYSIRNLHGFDVIPQIGANVYDILRHKELILTQDAVKLLEGRLK